jgi:RNA polymerase sigma-70 factor (ECF subfamily)
MLYVIPIKEAALVDRRHVTAADFWPDRQLVERAQQGDHDAFATLLDARLPATLRTVTAILGNEADARDATQAIFVKTWNELPSLRDVDRFPQWFGRIVVNTSRSALRQRRRRTVREISVSALSNAGESLVSRTRGHEERRAALDRLERALERIAPAERVVLWMHHYEQQSLGDIGERLGCPQGR